MMDEIAFLEELVSIPSPSGQAGTGIGDAGEPTVVRHLKVPCKPPRIGIRVIQLIADS